MTGQRIENSKNAYSPGHVATLLVILGFGMLFGAQAQAAIACNRTITADIVALDMPLMFNRLGAQNINGMM